MKFRDRENTLIWERYNAPYPSQPQIDDDDDEHWGAGTGSPDRMSGSYGEEDELEVMVFEPEMEIETEEHEQCNEVIYSDIKKLAEYSERILKICQEKELEPWMQAKLVKASDYVSDIWHRLDGKADFANTGFEQSDNIDF